MCHDSRDNLFALISFIEGVRTVVMIACSDKVIEQHIYQMPCKDRTISPTRMSNVHVSTITPSSLLSQ